MRRREFIALLSGTVATWPLTSSAQPASSPTRIGFLPLSSPSNASDLSMVEAFRKGIRDGGLLEGENVILDVVWTQDGSFTTVATKSGSEELKSVLRELARRSYKSVSG
jgi:hypothetical protein